MNPAVLNYLQSQQSNNLQAQPQEQPQGMQPQQGMGQSMSNPFNVGISKAIESARESLGMTQKQQDKALRSSMLTFADNMGQQPKQRGFFNNFASVGRAMSPAIRSYDAEEDAALSQNNNLANQILAYQKAQQDREAQEEERTWSRQHAENQLGEQKRSHNMMHSLGKNKQGNAKELHETEKKQQLFSTLDAAEETINALKDKGFRGRTTNILSNFIPGGGIRLTPEQAEINTIGDMLKGTLFNAWGYRNQAEFEHVPTISADNPPEVNQAIIKKLKEQFGIKASGFNDKKSSIGEIPAQGEDMSMQGISNQESVLMQDANGEQYRIPAEEVEGAMNEGLELVG